MQYCDKVMKILHVNEFEDVASVEEVQRYCGGGVLGHSGAVPGDSRAETFSAACRVVCRQEEGAAAAAVAVFTFDVRLEITNTNYKNFPPFIVKR